MPQRHNIPIRKTLERCVMKRNHEVPQASKPVRHVAVVRTIRTLEFQYPRAIDDLDGVVRAWRGEVATELIIGRTPSKRKEPFESKKGQRHVVGSAGVVEQEASPLAGHSVRGWRAQIWDGYVIEKTVLRGLRQSSLPRILLPNESRMSCGAKPAGAPGAQPSPQNRGRTT